MPGDIHVLGDYWRVDTDDPSPLGALVAAAKDRADTIARRELEARLAEFAASLSLGPGRTVVAVPPGPGRDAHPVPSLAAAVATAIGAELVHALDRRNPTARLRDTPPEHRQAVVAAAGYEVVGAVRGCDIVLVDDVILTGTTIGHVDGLLTAAGANRVDAIVACRTRRR